MSTLSVTTLTVTWEKQDFIIASSITSFSIRPSWAVQMVSELMQTVARCKQPASPTRRIKHPLLIVESEHAHCPPTKDGPLKSKEKKAEIAKKDQAVPFMLNAWD